MDLTDVRTGLKLFEQAWYSMASHNLPHQPSQLGMRGSWATCTEPCTVYLQYSLVRLGAAFNLLTQTSDNTPHSIKWSKYTYRVRADLHAKSHHSRAHGIRAETHGPRATGPFNSGVREKVLAAVQQMLRTVDDNRCGPIL